MKKNQEANKWDIVQMNPVKINNLDSCFYVEYFDRKKQFEKIDLMIRDEENDKSYYITSFKRIEDDDVKSENLKKSVLSTYLGKAVEKEELFKIASLDEKLNTVIYTKDGNFPTGSPGNGVVKLFFKKFGHESQIDIYMGSIAKTVTGTENYKKGIQVLSNGNYITYHFGSKEKNYVYIVVRTEDKESMVLNYECDSSEDTVEFLEYAQGNLVKFKPL